MPMPAGPMLPASGMRYSTPTTLQMMPARPSREMPPIRLRCFCDMARLYTSFAKGDDQSGFRLSPRRSRADARFFPDAAVCIVRCRRVFVKETREGFGRQSIFNKHCNNCLKKSGIISTEKIKLVFFLEILFDFSKKFCIIEIVLEILPRE